MTKFSRLTTSFLLCQGCDDEVTVSDYDRYNWVDGVEELRLYEKGN